MTTTKSHNRNNENLSQDTRPLPCQKAFPPLFLSDVTLREHGQNVGENDLSEFTVKSRIKTAEALIEAGFKRLELLSCVSPKVAPAMAPRLIESVAHGVGRPPGVEIVTLVANMKGLNTFFDIGLGPNDLNHTVGLFYSAVESHNMANLKKSIGKTRRTYKQIIDMIHAKGSSFVGYVTAAFGFRASTNSRIESVELESLKETVRWWFDLGAKTVTLSDLQGLSTPTQIHEVFSSLMGELNERDDVSQKGSVCIGFHPHHTDTSKALELIEQAYSAGIRLFDSSMNSLGGCVTGGPGNVSTQKVVSFFEHKGESTGIDLSKLDKAEKQINSRTDDWPVRIR